MINKMLINLKNETYDKLIIIYLAARKIQPNITKSTIISSLIENSIVEVPGTVSNKIGRNYTFSQLYNLGIISIKNAFKELIDIESDYTFLKSIDLFEIDSNNLIKKELLIKIVKDKFSDIISSTDLEILCNVIYPNGVYEHSDGYLRAIKSNEQEYWVFNELDLITKRYNTIKNKFKYYSILSEFIYKQFEKLELNSRYKFIYDNIPVNKNYDSYEFVQEFFEGIEKSYIEKSNYIEKAFYINEEFDCDSLKFLKEYSINLIKDNPNLDYHFFDINYYLYLLIESDLRKILTNVLYLNFRDYLNGTCFREVEIIYYRKRMVEILNIKKENDNFDYNRCIKVVKI